MLKKKEVQVKTIKYQGDKLPILVNFNGNSYLIQEIKSHEENTVFHRGGIGTKWTIVVNGKETLLCMDKHTKNWHVYHEVRYQESDNTIKVTDADDKSYLN